MRIPLYFPQKRAFWAVALGHLTNDTFMGMGAVVLAFLSVSIMPLSNTQIGLTISATQLMGAFMQPGFGILADRNGGRWIGAGGVAWTVGFFMIAIVVAQTGYFWLMFFPFVFCAVGSGAFHPAGAMVAANSDESRVATNMAYFFLMGQLGGAFGPFLAGQILDIANPSTTTLFTQVFDPAYTGEILWWGRVTPILILIVPVIPILVFIALSLPNAQSYRDERTRADADFAANGTSARARTALPFKVLLIFGVMVALRSMAQNGSVVFFPVLFQSKGWTPTQYGAITSTYWIAAAVAGVAFGMLADRIDRRLIIVFGQVVSAPAFFLLPLVDGEMAFVMAILAGGLVGGSHSIIVVLAQDLMPRSKGLASGAILGFIFATGALGSLLIGAASDIFGLDVTFQGVAIVMLVAGVLALAIPAQSPGKRRG